jgi:hypothetical protein
MQGPPSTISYLKSIFFRPLTSDDLQTRELPRTRAFWKASSVNCSRHVLAEEAEILSGRLGTGLCYGRFTPRKRRVALGAELEICLSAALKRGACSWDKRWSKPPMVHRHHRALLGGCICKTLRTSRAQIQLTVQGFGEVLDGHLRFPQRLPLHLRVQLRGASFAGPRRN